MRGFDSHPRLQQPDCIIAKRRSLNKFAISPAASRVIPISAPTHSSQLSAINIQFPFNLGGTLLSSSLSYFRFLLENLSAVPFSQWFRYLVTERLGMVDFHISAILLLNYSNYISQRIHMDIQATLDQLRQELSRIDQAIAALEQLGAVAPRRGRPPKSQAAPAGGRKRRTMSAAARAKIAAAQRARWARQKGNAAPKQAKTAAKKSRGRSGMSPAARRRLSALMKARWAARKKAA